jgi:hypothetical protein
MKIKPLHRRTFLRGMGGFGVALPVLDIMLNDHGDAFAYGGGALPTRFFVGFHGQAMGGDGDPLRNQYAPDAFGPDYDLKKATMPLAGYDNVKNDISIISNLRIPYNNSGPGSWNTEFHLGAMPPLLCGVSNPDDSSSCRGVTADQVVADAIGQDTTFASLQYQVQVSWYLTDSAPYGRDIMSYAQDQAGNIIQVPGQTSPRQAWMSLFTGFVPPDPGDALAAQLELARRRSVLDLVRGNIEVLMPKLGTADKARMQRHFDEIRDLEDRLAAIPPDATGECMMFADPGPDPAIGGNNASAGGADFDVNAGYSDESARARVFSDLVHMAFTCDLSRSVAMLYTMAQSHMNVYAFTDSQIPYDQHEVGHSVGTTDAVSEVLAWQLDLFAYLVAKLRDTPEGAGNVLDNTAMVLLYEGGHGLDPATGDPNRTHSTENMIVTTAGRAGGFVAGEHIDGGGLHPVNVLNTAMRAVGVDQDLGEVTGIVPALLP